MQEFTEELDSTSAELTSDIPKPPEDHLGYLSAASTISQDYHTSSLIIIVPFGPD